MLLGWIDERDAEIFWSYCIFGVGSHDGGELNIRGEKKEKGVDGSTKAMNLNLKGLREAVLDRRNWQAKVHKVTFICVRLMQPRKELFNEYKYYTTPAQIILLKQNTMCIFSYIFYSLVKFKVTLVISVQTNTVEYNFSVLHKYKRENQ